MVISASGAGSCAESPDASPLPSPDPDARPNSYVRSIGLFAALLNSSVCVGDGSTRPVSRPVRSRSSIRDAHSGSCRSGQRYPDRRAPVSRLMGCCFIPAPTRGAVGPRCLPPVFCIREGQFPIPIQGPNDSRPRWLASASTPDLPVAGLVVGGVPRNQKAPATWGGPRQSVGPSTPFLDDK
jgi:hypothetical protein